MDGVNPKIFNEIQKWIDIGWEPVGEIDQSGLQFHTYKKLHVEPMSIFLMLFFIGFLLVIIDLLNPWEYEEVVEYRISMRRRR